MRHFLLLTFFFYQLASIDTWPPIEEEGGVASVYDPAGLRAAAPSSVDFRVHKMPAPNPPLDASSFHQNFFPIFGRNIYANSRLIWIINLNESRFFGMLWDSLRFGLGIFKNLWFGIKNLWESLAWYWESLRILNSGLRFFEILWDALRFLEIRTGNLQESVIWGQESLRIFDLELRISKNLQLEAKIL